MNSIEDSHKNCLASNSNSACILLKVTFVVVVSYPRDQQSYIRSMSPFTLKKSKPPQVLQTASPWREGDTGRSGRSTSGVYYPGRVTQGVKATPLCPGLRS
ncbi:hypothetical protein TNCV_1874431 [Trichonephila clavipes]|nr:hypothetical protein TNCV_1874431 [Trichonephila clavipes]